MNKNTTLALSRDLFQIMKQFSRLRLQYGPVDGLKRSENELLMVLAINVTADEKAFTVTEISSLLQITPAGVTHLINPLEDAGYIERLQDKNDRRIVRVRLTKEGAEIAKVLISDVQGNLADLVNHLGEEDSKSLIRLMYKSVEFFTSRFEK